MFLSFEDRPSSSPLVESIWRSRSTTGGLFHSMAEGNIELVVTRLPGLTRVTLRGPVTKPTQALCPPDGEWLAIRFRAGTFLPYVPTALLLDHRSLDLPMNGDRFCLQGSMWAIPSFENAECFVARLARAGLITLDRMALAAFEADTREAGLRSIQRHFLKSVGMTYARYRQIERARHAVALLRSGRTIQDTSHDAGYFDQAHMTRAFKTLIGQSPLKVLRQEAQLSFLCNTPRALPE